MPVRKVSNWGGNITGSFPSLKMEPFEIDYESTIERDLLPFLEFDPTVIKYYAQPMVISSTDADEETHKYTPDFLVLRTSGKEIIECKPEDLLDHQHTLQQIQIGQDWANANSHDFVMVTDTDLYKDHTLANLKLFWRYARLKVPTVMVATCIAHFKKCSEALSFEDLTIYLSSLQDAQGTQKPFEQAPFIYSMLFRHVLQVDLTRPITSTNMIRLSTSKDSIQIRSYTSKPPNHNSCRRF
jgi:TnsA endonuclease N terminal